ncbi:hypothetical protein ACFLYU_00910 [Candidatus Dependentiae bacterium]
MLKINKFLIFTTITLLATCLAKGMIKTTALPKLTVKKRTTYTKEPQNELQNVVVRPITRQSFYKILKTYDPQASINLKKNITNIAIEKTNNAIVLRHIESNKIIYKLTLQQIIKAASKAGYKKTLTNKETSIFEALFFKGENNHRILTTLENSVFRCKLSLIFHIEKNKFILKVYAKERHHRINKRIFKNINKIKNRLSSYIFFGSSTNKKLINHPTYELKIRNKKLVITHKKTKNYLNVKLGCKKGALDISASAFTGHKHALIQLKNNKHSFYSLDMHTGKMKNVYNCRRWGNRLGKLTFGKSGRFIYMAIKSSKKYENEIIIYDILKKKPYLYSILPKKDNSEIIEVAFSNDEKYIIAYTKNTQYILHNPVVLTKIQNYREKIATNIKFTDVKMRTFH